MSPVPPSPGIDPAAIDAIRAHHRGTFNAGLVACLLGVMVMVAGRFAPGAPVWLTSVGVGVVVFGWGLLAYAAIRRAALARATFARADQSKAGG